MNEKKKVLARPSSSSKKMAGSNLQSYTNNKIKNIYKFLESAENETVSNPKRSVETMEKEYEYQQTIQHLRGINEN